MSREGDNEYDLYLNFKGEEDKRGSPILGEGSSVENREFTTNLLIHFFQADTVEEFRHFYDNIRKWSLYDTGVTA